MSSGALKTLKIKYLSKVCATMDRARIQDCECAVIDVVFGPAEYHPSSKARVYFVLFAVNGVTGSARL